MLKVAMVGLGGISTVHLNGWKQAQGAELVAVCDIRREQAEKAAEGTSWAIYDDLDSLLAQETFDVLDICTPTFCHTEHALKAMRAGKHVLVEKPISLHKDDVDLLYRTAEECHVKFMVAHVIRFWDEYVTLKQAIDDKRYGRLLGANFHRLSEVPRWSWENWMQNPERSGLTPFDLHIHDLDFIVYTFGKPQDVQSYRGRDGIQDAIHALYDYGDFCISAEAAWYDCPYPFHSGFRVQFEKGVLELSDGVMTFYSQEGEKQVLNGTPAALETSDNGGVTVPTSDAYGVEIQYFADCVNQDKIPDKVKPEELKTVLALLHSL